MLSGRRAFAERKQREFTNAVQSEPSFSVPDLSPSLQRVIDLCLTEDPDERWQSAGDLKRELAWISEGEAKTRALWWQPAAIIAFFVVLCAVGAGWTGYRMRVEPVPPPPARFSLSPPQGTAFRPGGELALSPNGEQLVFSAVTPNGKTMLWIRPLNELTSRVIPGSEGGQSPFWAPDSHALAFFANGHLKRVTVSGGPIQIVCDAPDGRGASWGPYGDILFSAKQYSPVLRVSSLGGLPAPVTALDLAHEDDAHSRTSFLPDGRHFLYIASSSRHADTLYVGSLDNKEVKFLRGSVGRALYHAGLMYYSDKGLHSQPFDLARLEFTGEPNSVVESIDGVNAFDIAENRGTGVSSRL